MKIKDIPTPSELKAAREVIKAAREVIMRAVQAGLISEKPEKITKKETRIVWVGVTSDEAAPAGCRILRVEVPSAIRRDSILVEKFGVRLSRIDKPNQTSNPVLIFSTRELLMKAMAARNEYQITSLREAIKYGVEDIKNIKKEIKNQKARLAKMEQDLPSITQTLETLPTEDVVAKAATWR